MAFSRLAWVTTTRVYSRDILGNRTTYYNRTFWAITFTIVRYSCSDFTINLQFSYWLFLEISVQSPFGINPPSLICPVFRKYVIVLPKRLLFRGKKVWNTMLNVRLPKEWRHFFQLNEVIRGKPFFLNFFSTFDYAKNSFRKQLRRFIFSFLGSKKHDN